MENKYPEIPAYNFEKSIVPEQKKHRAVTKQQPVLLQLFKEVFLGFFADIVKGVYGFFKRYFVLIWNCTKFLWKPNADEHTSANERTIHHAKETFELILVITGITLFVIKQGWMESTDELKSLYGDDISQYLVELMLFLFYAVIFFVVLFMLVLLCRLLRVLFKPIESRDVTDKVFINLNNIFFIVTVIYAFVRKFDPYNSTDLQNIEPAWYAIWFVTYAVPLAIIVFLFFIRLVMINKVTFGRALVYCLIAPTFTLFLLAITGLFFTALFAGI